MPERKICIIGDSIIKNIKGHGITKINTVSVHWHSAATNNDLIDHTKPSVWKKQDMIIIHTGTNNWTNGVNTYYKIKTLVTTVKENDQEKKIQIGFSEIILRDDIDKKNETKNLNETPKHFCGTKGMFF